jgi:hypothetical protein
MVTGYPIMDRANQSSCPGGSRLRMSWPCGKCRSRNQHPELTARGCGTIGQWQRRPILSRQHHEVVKRAPWLSYLPGSAVASTWAWLAPQPSRCSFAGSPVKDREKGDVVFAWQPPEESADHVVAQHLGVAARGMRNLGEGRLRLVDLLAPALEQSVRVQQQRGTYLERGLLFGEVVQLPDPERGPLALVRYIAPRAGWTSRGYGCPARAM